MDDRERMEFEAYLEALAASGNEEQRRQAFGPDAGALIWISLAGFLYIAAEWYAPTWHALFGVDFPLTIAFLREHSTRIALVDLALRIPAFGLLVYAFLRYTAFSYSLRNSRRSVLKSILIVAVVAFLGGLTSLWPWTWTLPGNPGVLYVYTILEEARYLDLSILLFLGVLIDPLLEEALFRFAMLRALLVSTASPLVAILFSSVAFTLVHFGPNFVMLPGLLWHSLWIFSFGLLLGWVTLKREGNIAIAWAAHGTVNAVNTVSLIVTVVLVN